MSTCDTVVSEPYRVRLDPNLFLFRENIGPESNGGSRVFSSVDAVFAIIGWNVGRGSIVALWGLSGWTFWFAVRQLVVVALVVVLVEFVLERASVFRTSTEAARDFQWLE